MRDGSVYLVLLEVRDRVSPSPAPCVSLKLFLCVAGNQNYSQSQKHWEVSRAPQVLPRGAWAIPSRLVETVQMLYHVGVGAWPPVP